MMKFKFLVVFSLVVFGFSGVAEARLHRSAGEISHFKQRFPCPSTGLHHGRCPGFIIDHRVALACGGADKPWNMQWQTVAEAKAKDRWERRGCR